MKLNKHLTLELEKHGAHVADEPIVTGGRTLSSKRKWSNLKQKDRGGNIRAIKAARAARRRATSGKSPRGS